MKPKDYYFQIKTTYKGWGETPAFSAYFLSRQEAVEKAKETAKLWGCEVRLTDNANLLQGSYFRPELHKKQETF